jgi:DNA polymerase
MHAPLLDTKKATDASTAHVLHRDVETRSVLDLRKVGAHIYATHPMTEVLWVGFAVDDGPVQLWWQGEPVPPEFIEAAVNPDWVVCAHNDSFETQIERHVLHPRYGFPLTPMARHCCTQAASLAMGLPAKLKNVAKALNLQHQKDEAGERLMHQTCKPRKPRKDEDPNGIFWFEDDDRLARLGRYCEQDVRVERELHSRIPMLSTFEHRLWLLSNKINDRGFHVDRQFAEAGCEIACAAAPEIDAELAEVTDGAVTGVHQIAKMKRWLGEQGL